MFLKKYVTIFNQMRYTRAHVPLCLIKAQYVDLPYSTTTKQYINEFKMNVIMLIGKGIQKRFLDTELLPRMMTFSRRYINYLVLILWACEKYGLE